MNVAEVIPRVVLGAVDIGIFTVQQAIVDVARPGDVLHVPINVRMGRIVGEGSLIINALLAQLPIDRVVHHPLLVETASASGGVDSKKI